MENKPIINTRQFVWLLFILFTSFAVVEIPAILISIARRDCWLSVIFAWALDVTLGTIYAYMGIRFRGQNLIQHSITLWGKYLGRIPGLILVVFFFIFCCCSQYSFSLVIRKMLLQKTPQQIVLFTSFIAAAYGAKKGLKIIGRFCEIIGPLFLGSLLTLTIFIVPKVQIDNLKPQFDAGVLPLCAGSIFILTFLGICIMMTIYIPLNDKPENGFLGKALASSLGSFIILLFVIMIIGIFGITQAKEMFYPGFELARIIQWEYFFERVESIWIVITITASIVSASNLIWVCSLGISQLTGIMDHKFLINSVAALSAVMTFTSFNNGVELQNFYIYVYPIFPIIITLLELLLLLTAVIRKKRIN